MAEDIARLGVEIQTNAKKATSDLHAFGQEARKTSAQTERLKKAASGLDVTYNILGSSLTYDVSALGKQAVGLDASTNSLQRNTKAQMSNNKAIEDAVKGRQRLAASQRNLQKTLAGATGLDTRGAAQANRFNSSNFLAQFQDIAVTSAMGMNPALIAMQQGTQLQYILAQSNAPLKDFVAGLKSAFSGIGILTIGLTGLVAALIQMVDWVNVGKTALNAFAKVFDWVANNSDNIALGLGLITTALIAMNFTTIMLTAKILLLQGAILGLTAVQGIITMLSGAAQLILNPWVLIPAVVIAAVEAFAHFKDNAKSFLDNTIDNIVDFVNKTIGYFKGLKEVIMEIPQLIKTAWNDSLSAANDKITEIMNKNMAEKYIDSKGIKSAVNSAVDTASAGILKVNEVLSESISSVAKTASNGLKSWSDGLGKTDEKLKKTKSEVEKLAEAWDKLNVSAQQKIQDLMMQKNLIGAGTYETVYTQTLTDLKRQAEGEGIELTDEKITQLKEYAEDTARLSDEVEKLNDRYNLANSTVKSFFSQMRQGLKEGESAWEAFGNAVLNVLDKVIDKMMDIGVDALFMAGRSYFGDISSGSTWNPATSAPAVKPTMAANGGVFSNGIYSSPTVFQFAKGGKFGVMGEAGPEAVMPLTRGPDGSLGVKAANTNSSPVIVNVINNSTAQAHVEQRQTSQGVELDVIIDQLVAEKMNKPGTSSNTALKAVANQKLIAR